MLLLRCFALLMPVLAIGQGLDGVVVDASGRGIGGALVIASGVGTERSDITKPDGSFHLKAAGAFMSVRHMAFVPVVVRAAELSAPVRIQLAFAGEPMLELPRCKSLPAGGRGWIGGELRLKPSGSVRGPEMAGDVSHWYIKSGKSTLHIVEGDLAHAGLPTEEVLQGAVRINARAWSYHGAVGLDLRGESRDGLRWRWYGTSTGSAFEYVGVPAEDAAKFDAMMRFACDSATQLERR
ncbi:MAG TPA: carboxypeptidase-like regulatory domain-containing protein [Bryobacteraceae bacterium]|jgi:hypothetical protein|nr:carboxypeptidase-like regulatory domain-containing protein [Bryobacteraceae bacterium]